MNFFTAENGKLIFENNGETLQIEAWGENSLRIRSRDKTSRCNPCNRK